MNSAQMPDMVESITRRPTANDVVKKLLGDLPRRQMADGGSVKKEKEQLSPPERMPEKSVDDALNAAQVTPGVLTELLGRLINRRDGGAVEGPGDGRSDDVVASHGAFGDVRLSDGEFIVPADAVSALGNGSTDAGAERLNDMVTQWRAEWVARMQEFPEPGENDG